MEFAIVARNDMYDMLEMIGMISCVVRRVVWNIFLNFGRLLSFLFRKKAYLM